MKFTFFMFFALTIAYCLEFDPTAVLGYLFKDSSESEDDKQPAPSIPDQ